MMYLLRPELDEAGAAAAIAKMSELVTANGGEVSKAETWGPRRRLAYPIKTCREAQYVLMQFKLDPQALAEVERTVRITDDVIRYLVIRLDD